MQEYKKLQIPLVGVGVMILKNNKMLLGKRKGAHGAGEYSFPGGHLEHMESIRDCARREVHEETDLLIRNVRYQFMANITKYRPKHYVHIGVTAEWDGGAPRVREPEKCESWDWYPFDNLPSPLFEMCRLAFYSWKRGITFYDIADSPAP